MKNKKIFQKLAVTSASLALMIGVVFLLQRVPIENLKFLRTAFIDNFTILPNTFENVFPLSGSTVDSNFRTFVVKFTRPMDATTITAGNITMKDALNNAVAGTVTYDSNTWQATWKASANFTITADNNPHTLTVSSGIKDATGANLADTISATYTINNTVNNDPPTFPSPYPINNATNVSIYDTSAIDISFNVPLDPTTVTSANLSVTTTPPTNPLTTIADIGTVTYNPYVNAIEILPTGILLANTTYAITASANIKGANQVAIAPYTTSFATGSTNENQPAPVVVWSDFKTDSIEIEWNSAMKKSAIEDRTNYTLTCDGSSVSLASAFMKWNAQTLHSTIKNLTLTDNASCTLILSVNITNINNTAAATASRTQTGTVHAPYGGKTFLTNSTATTGGSWLNLDNCSSYTDLNLANCPSFIFNNPLNVTLSDLIGNQLHTSTAIFTIPVVKSFTTGYKLVITAPPGFLVGGATINNVLNNDITPGDSQIVKFSSITKDDIRITITLVLNVANNATITTGSQLKFAIDNINNTNIAGTYKFEYKLTDANNITVQDGVFNSISLVNSDDSTAAVRVLDRSNNNAIANVKVVFKAPNIGQSTITTDGTGTATFSLLPNTGMHIDAYIMGDSVPDAYLPSWTNTTFDLAAGTTTTTKTLYLDPANFTINVTIQHSGIGTDGTKKVDIYASGPNGWVSKPVTLSATGTTSVTLRTGKGEYSVGIGQHFEPQSGGTDTTSFVSPVPKSVKVGTGLPTPAVIMSLAQANKHITGTILDTNGKPLNNVQVVATKNQNETDVWFTAYAVTGTRGTFDLAVLSGKYTLTAEIYGLAGKIEKFVAVETTDTNIALGNLTLKKPARYISGTVQDSNGNKIINTVVNCYNATTLESAKGLTNSNGLYVVYIPAGTYACETWAPLLGPIPAASGVNTTAIVVGSSDVTGINFSLNRANNGNITVTVRNSSGTAVEGNFVWAEIFNKTTKQFIAYSNGASTDQAGQVTLNVTKNNAATEVYYIKTLGANNETLTIASNVNVASADANLGTFNFPAYQQVTINVIGLPSNISDATINIHNETTDNWSTATAAIANGTGSTTVNLNAGSYTGYLRSSGISEIIKTFTVTGNATSVNFDISTTQILAAVVLVKDINSTALKDVFVSAFDQDKDNYVSSTTGSNGLAGLNLVAGTYLISAAKQNYISASTTVIVSATSTNNFTLVLTAASSNIVLSIKDTNNNAVANAWVDATASDGSNKWTGGQTDGNGALTLKVEPGIAWNITARAENGTYGTASNVSAGSSTVTITLNQTQSGFVATNPKTVSINPTRDNVVSSDVAKLTIPAGAMGKNSSGTNVSIKNVTNTPNVGVLGALGNQAVEISTTDSNGKPVTNLNSDVTTEITLNKARVEALINSGIAAEKLNTPVGFFNNATNSWETVKGSSIYVTRQPKAGDQPITTTITDFLNKRKTDYAGDYDYVIHYVFKPNHLTLFAPLATKDDVENTPALANGNLLKPAAETPCKQVSGKKSIFTRFLEFMGLKSLFK